MDYHYMVHKKEVPLRVDDRTILVIDDGDRPHEEVAQSLGLAGFSGRKVAPWRHVFERPNTAGAGAVPPIPALIRELAGRPGNSYFFSPHFLLVDPKTGEPLADGGGVLMEKRIEVRFSPDLKQGEAQSILSTTIPNGKTATRAWLGDENTFIYEVFSSSAIEVLDYANRLASMDEVLWANPTLEITGGGPSSEGGGSCTSATMDPAQNPEYSQSWFLETINAPKAWVACGGPGPIFPADVALIFFDDGIDNVHEDINQLTPGRNVAILPENCPGGIAPCMEIGGEPREFCDRHGTTVAGVAAARLNNGLGSTGIAPNVRVFSMKTFRHRLDGSGKCLSDPYDGKTIRSDWTCEAVNWVRTKLRSAYPGELGPDTRIVTNMSWNWQSEFSCLRTEFQESRDKGIVQIVSAGNLAGGGPVQFPATRPEVFAVGATDEADQRWSDSRYGPEVDIAAPGTNIFTTDRMGIDGWSPTDYFSSINENGELSGTSWASPLIAGAAALILRQNPQMTVNEVEARLCVGAVPLPGQGMGCGRFSAGDAVEPWLFKDGFETGDTSAWSSEAIN